MSSYEERSTRKERAQQQAEGEEIIRRELSKKQKENHSISGYRWRVRRPKELDIGACSCCRQKPELPPSLMKFLDPRLGQEPGAIGEGHAKLPGARKKISLKPERKFDSGRILTMTGRATVVVALLLAASFLMAGEDKIAPIYDHWLPPEVSTPEPTTALGPADAMLSAIRRCLKQTATKFESNKSGISYDHLSKIKGYMRAYWRLRLSYSEMEETVCAPGRGVPETLAFVCVFRIMDLKLHGDRGWFPGLYHFSCSADYQEFVANFTLRGDVIDFDGPFPLIEKVDAVACVWTKSGDTMAGSAIAKLRSHMMVYLKTFLERFAVTLRTCLSGYEPVDTTQA